MLYRLFTILDWALIAASLFNTIAMLWLGLAVLLNAERRSWGTWLAGGGLILGALFFAGHTAVVGRVIGDTSAEMIFYWRLGWLVLIVAPYLWYLVMAWYAGVATTGRERLRLAGVSILGLCALLLALFVDPLPSYGELVNPPTDLIGAVGAAPVVRLIYPGFATLCIVLALSVLRAPAASDRFMGDLARRRARPWLIATSLVLLLIALAIGAGAVWFLERVIAGLLPVLTVNGLALLIGFDLTICLLIAAAVVLIGQAVVAYEVFTGAGLPRGELARQWRRALILAGGYGLLVGWSMSGAGLPEQPVYQLVLATLATTAFYALLGWRSVTTRAPALGRLRPFVASQRLFDRLLGPAALPADSAAAEPTFRALVDELLAARVGYLVPLGSLAPLAGPPLSHPAGHRPPAQAAALAATFEAPLPLCRPIDPELYGGAAWAVPLQGERGLIGLLLIGDKRDGGLYTQEEIEVARAAGERLIDAQAAAEMARRLVALQRRRLAEGQILDRRTRRVLHDEVLPQIHLLLLEMSKLEMGDSRLNNPTIQPHNLQSPISNPQSPIPNLQSPISNPQSPIPNLPISKLNSRPSTARSPTCSTTCPRPSVPTWPASALSVPSAAPSKTTWPAPSTASAGRSPRMPKLWPVISTRSAPKPSTTPPARLLATPPATVAATLPIAPST